MEVIGNPENSRIKQHFIKMGFIPPIRRRRAGNGDGSQNPASALAYHHGGIGQERDLLRAEDVSRSIGRSSLLLIKGQSIQFAQAG